MANIHNWYCSEHSLAFSPECASKYNQRNNPGIYLNPDIKNPTHLRVSRLPFLGKARRCNEQSSALSSRQARASNWTRSQGKDVMMSTPEIAGYPAQELCKKVTSLESHRSEIFNAIDFLLNGFY